MKPLRLVCLLLLLAPSAAFAGSPVPLIDQPLVPDSIPPGSAGFTLTVNGTGFTSSAEVYWNGSIRSTTVLSSSSLQAQISAADVAQAGTASVTVGNLGVSEVFSNVVYFPIHISTKGFGFQPTGIKIKHTGPVATGDFNDDGNLDFTVVHGKRVEVYLGNGDGTFQSAIVNPLARAPFALVTGDFNNDGNLDLLCLHDNVSTILLGKGDGTFDEKDVSIPHSLRALASAEAADFDSDGNLDFYVGGDYGGAAWFAIFLGHGDGTFTEVFFEKLRKQNPFGYAALGDFNRDGVLDLAFARSNDDGQGVVDVYLGEGGGRFASRVSYRTKYFGNSVTTADVNGDGKLDLVTNGVSVLLGNGDGTFESAGGVSVETPQSFANIGDFNADGNLDIAAGFAVLLGDGDGKFQEPLSFAGLVAGYLPIATGDFNSDGKLDLIGYNSLSGELSVFLQVRAYLTPVRLDFGTVSVGSTSQPQNATLTNFNPNSPLVITKLGISGTNKADFHQTHTCRAQLQPNQSCKIKVKFTPSVAEGETASLNVTYENGGTLSMPLSGVGTTQTLTVTLAPSSMTFPIQLVGTTSSPQQATLTNTGNQPVNISQISATTPFSQTNNCPASLDVGQKCGISITFTPSDKGIVNGTLSVIDNAQGSPQQVMLSGTGTAVVLSPTAINFGNQKVGTTSAPIPVTLSNLGTNKLSITTIQITGADPGDFSQMNNCGNSVPPQGQCTITVTFTPTATGKRTAAVSITDDDPSSPQSVPLSGKGT